MVNNNKNKWMSIFLFSMMLLFTGTVFAADPTALDLTVSDTDQSYKLLEAIFGLEGPDGSLKAETNLTNVFGVFNAIVLMFGGILLAYTMIAGTLNTAHDGEMLGKKWSSIWIPVRTALGVAAVFPMSNGYSMIQGLVIWLVLQGAGAANLAWTAFNKSPFIADSYNVQVDTSQLMAAGNAMFSNSVCMETFKVDNYRLENPAEGVKVEGIAKSYVTVPIITPPTDKAPGIIKYNYNEFDNSKAVGAWEIIKKEGLGIGKGQEGGTPVCGMVQVTLPALIPATPTTSTSTLLGGLAVDEAKINSLRIELFNFNVEAFKEVEKQASKAAKQYTDNYFKTNCTVAPCDQIPASTNMNYDIKSIVASYESNLIEKTRSFLKDNIDNSEYLELIKRDGWLFAGAYYMKISKTKNEIDASLRTNTTSESPGAGMQPSLSATSYVTTGKLDSAMASDTSKDMKSCLYKSDGWFSKSMDWVSDKSIPIISSVASFSSFSVKAFDHLADEDPTRLMECMVSKVGISQAFMPNDNLGDNFILRTQVEGAHIAERGLYVYATTMLAGMVPILQNNATLFLTFNAIGTALLVLGLTLSLYVPMLPYIIWMGAVFGWVVLVIEAVIAAPLWAIMHIHPHGDDFSGKGAPGYTMLLTIVFKPLLMVLGFVFALVVIDPLGNLLNTTYYSVYKMSGATDVSASLIKPFIIIFAMMIYVGLLMTLINKVFGLIHEVPDAVVRWFGGHGSIGQSVQDAKQQGNTYGMGVISSGSRSMQGTSDQTARTMADRGLASKRDKVASEKAESDSISSIAKGLASSDPSEVDKAKVAQASMTSKMSPSKASSFNDRVASEYGSINSKMKMNNLNSQLGGKSGESNKSDINGDS